jgi:type I restriction enzyme S subunit
MVGYLKYKYSGFSWIGDIPEHWEIKRSKYVAKLYNGDSLNDEQKNAYSDFSESDETIPYIASKDIDKDSCSVDYLNGTRIPKKEKNTNGRPFSKAPAGSSLLCIEGGSAGKKRCILDREVNFVNKLCCFVPKINGKFLFYYICSNSYWENFKQNLQGMIGGVTVTKLGSFPIPIPSDNEQKAIADYLDEESSRIEKLIRTEERSVELLQELKQTIITKAVTEGVDASAALKDTGLQCVGRIPSHWELPKTLYVLEMPITDGPHETPKLFDDGIPFISAEAVSGGEIDFEQKRGYISEEYYHECCKKYIPQRDDIYMIKSGATTGRIAMVKTDEVFTIWSPLAVFRADNKRITPQFLFYALMSDYYQRQVQLNWSYGTQQNIGMRTLEKLKIALPPIDEQEKIVTEIVNRTQSLNEAIKKAKKQIDLLREYKQSLITEIVTGKQKIC